MEASGAVTRIATDQASAVQTGCCIDQAALVAEGLGFPHSVRTILLALHMRMHDVGRAALGELEGNENDVEHWRLSLHRLVDLVLSHRKLFELHARNHAALEELQRTTQHAREHDDLEGRFRAVGSNPALPFETRARIAGAMGAVMDVARWASDAGVEVPEHEFAAILRRMVDDLLAER
jgi:hypothetical protein